MDSGFVDQEADMKQRGSANVENKLVGKQIEVLSKYFDEAGEVLAVWEKGEVNEIHAMKEKNQQQKKNGQQKKGSITKKENHWEL